MSELTTNFVTMQIHNYSCGCRNYNGMRLIVRKYNKAVHWNLVVTFITFIFVTLPWHSIAQSSLCSITYQCIKAIPRMSLLFFCMRPIAVNKALN